MDLRVLLVIIVCIQCALGIYVPSGKRDFRKKATAAPMTTESEYSELLRDLAVIKLKMESMSYGSMYLVGPYDSAPMAKSLKDVDMSATLAPSSDTSASVTSDDDDDPPAAFNEMAVLELIPVIIEQKRKGHVSPSEEATLKEIFGDLWIVIEEEVNRTMDEEMNPILKALLQSNESRLKRALVQHHHQQQQREVQQYDHASGLNVEEQNDIFGNTVDRVRVTRWPKSFVEVNPAELSPQQRLMRHAAFQIRQWFDQNAPKVSSGSRAGRLMGLKRNRNQQKNKKMQKRRRGGSGRRGPSKARRNQNRQRRVNGGENRRRKQLQQNFRPKRHNTEIYVDDNHGYAFDYEDFEDHSYDDAMSKPRSMRSSFRPVYDEFDSSEADDEDEYVD